MVLMLYEHVNHKIWRYRFWPLFPDFDMSCGLCAFHSGVLSMLAWAHGVVAVVVTVLVGKCPWRDNNLIKDPQNPKFLKLSESACCACAVHERPCGG